MAASPNSEQPSTGHRITITSDGVTHVFDSLEAARAFVHRPKTKRERERDQEAVRMIEALRASVREGTGGKGIAAEDLDEALRFARNH